MTRLRSTTRFGMSLLEYMTFVFLVLFCVVVFIPEVRVWVMENLFQVAAIR